MIHARLLSGCLLSLVSASASAWEYTLIAPDKPVQNWSISSDRLGLRDGLAFAVGVHRLSGGRQEGSVLIEIDTGALQLVSLQKGIKLRISDYVSEYDFPSYRYPAGFQTAVIKPIEDGLTHEEGFKSPTGGRSSAHSGG